MTERGPLAYVELPNRSGRLLDACSADTRGMGLPTIGGRNSPDQALRTLDLGTKPSRPFEGLPCVVVCSIRTIIPLRLMSTD